MTNPNGTPPSLIPSDSMRWLTHCCAVLGWIAAAFAFAIRAGAIGNRVPTTNPIEVILETTMVSVGVATIVILTTIVTALWRQAKWYQVLVVHLATVVIIGVPFWVI